MPESNWRDLCERIKNERDSEELMMLVEELNRTLARQGREQQHLGQSETQESIKDRFPFSQP